MIRIYPYSLLIFVMALGISMVSSSQAHAQRVDMVQFTTLVNSEVKKSIRRALDEKLSWFYEEYKYMPYLHYALVDLNNDGKSEIIVQLNVEWEFRDRNNNIDTHIFAQTSKGLFQILETQTSKIGIGRADESGLKTLYVYKRPNENRPIIFKWDGQKEYKKQK